jgi:hypothetical protein
VLDLSLSGVYLYKLLVFDLDVLPWTHIWFGYSALRSTFSIFADIASHKGTAYANLVELIFVCVVWTLFYLHLKKRFPMTTGVHSVCMQYALYLLATNSEQRSRPQAACPQRRLPLQSSSVLEGRISYQADCLPIQVGVGAR